MKFELDRMADTLDAIRDHLEAVDKRLVAIEERCAMWKSRQGWAGNLLSLTLSGVIIFLLTRH